jgi:hypothetical protein
MFGNNPRMNPLESRKRLLIAESELNRTQLVQEWVALAAGVRTLTGRVKSFGGGTVGGGPRGLPAWPARARRRETFLAPDGVERRASGRLHLAGLSRAIPLMV